MTEKRLVEILIDNRLSRGYVGDEMSETIKEAMKQAVNEALDEAAEKATTKMVVGRTKPFKAINRDSILNLKVK